MQRRLDLMAAEGIVRTPRVCTCSNYLPVTTEPHPSMQRLPIPEGYHGSVHRCDRASRPEIPSRSANGIHFAIEYLQKNAESLLNWKLEDILYIEARGKDIIVIGGGDTGNYCIGTATPWSKQRHPL